MCANNLIDKSVHIIHVRQLVCLYNKEFTNDIYIYYIVYSSVKTLRNAYLMYVSIHFIKNYFISFTNNRTLLLKSIML